MGKPAYDYVEVIETKECLDCYQLIDSRATRCPYCCSFLDKPPQTKLKRMRVAVVCLIVIAAVGWAAFWYSHDQEGSNRGVGMPQKIEAAAPSDESTALELEVSKPDEVLNEATPHVPEKMPLDVRKQYGFEFDSVLVNSIVSCKGNLITNISCGI